MVQQAQGRSRARVARVVLLLLALVVSTSAALVAHGDGSLVPPLWPASGLAAGLFLTTPRRWRWPVLLLAGAALLVLQTAAGTSPTWTLTYTVTTLVEAVVVRQRLTAAGHRATLDDDGDVSRLVGAVGAGALLAAAASGTVVLLSAGPDGLGAAGLTALAVLGTHAASLMVLLPLFLPTSPFRPLATRRERVAQWVLLLATTVLVFSSAAAPPLVFAVMPMFGWLAFRGTIREGTVLLTVVATIGIATTSAGIGPMWGLASRYGLAPELVYGVLQLFLLDCALIMLPLAVAVTQQRLAAAEAATERELLARLISSATGTGIIATDRGGTITVFNPGAEQMLRLHSAEVLGRNLDVLEPRSADGLATSSADVLAAATSDEQRRDWVLRRGDGRDRTLSLHVTALTDVQGGQAGFLVTAEDVTDAVEARAALVATLRHEQAAVARLEDLDQVKSDFVATVSHELRTPISSIRGFTELLEDGAAGELTADQADLVHRVSRNSQRLLLLIEDLLLLSRIEARSLSLAPQQIDLRSVVRTALEGLGPVLEQRTLDLHWALPDHPVRLDGDPVQLERLVSNLLTNAVKFTPDGGRVEVEVRPGPDEVALLVRDTGLGIPTEEQDQLFTRFFRSTTATRQAIQGTGLGLTIVQAIAQGHEGSVSVESAAGAGTTVTVTLPTRVATGEPPAPGDRSVEPSTRSELAAPPAAELALSPESAGLRTA